MSELSRSLLHNPGNQQRTQDTGEESTEWPLSLEIIFGIIVLTGIVVTIYACTQGSGSHKHSNIGNWSPSN